MARTILKMLLSASLATAGALALSTPAATAGSLQVDPIRLEINAGRRTRHPSAGWDLRLWRHAP